MTKLIKKIVLDKKSQKLYVDDEEFPFYVKDKVEAVELTHGFSGVEITLIAEEVEVIE